MNPNQGYLYVATGDKYLEEAIKSAKSLKSCNEQLHITLITDQYFQHDIFNEVLVLAKDENLGSNFDYKILGIQNSPYDRTFFVDTDTYFIESCEELFERLDFYELLITYDPGDAIPIYHEEKNMEGYQGYNTGVLVFKKTKNVELFLKEWLEISQKTNYPHDQPPFMLALLKRPLHLWVMHVIYNFRLIFYVAIPALKVRLIHDRDYNAAQIADKLNEKIRQRAWHPLEQRVMYNVFGKNRSTVIRKRTAKYHSRLSRILRKLFS